MSDNQQAIVARCRQHYRQERCPLPLDLHMEAEGLGIDTEALEESCLHNDEDNQEDEDR